MIVVIAQSFSVHFTILEARRSMKKSIFFLNKKIFNIKF